MIEQGTTMQDALEKVIRPIVEGQIRGFLKEHPNLVDAVDWYKPRDDKATTFINSLSKRIIRDLLCSIVRARMAAALFGKATEAPSNSTVALGPAAEVGPLGNTTERADGRALSKGQGTT